MAGPHLVRGQKACLDVSGSYCHLMVPETGSQSNVVRRVWIIKSGEPGDEVQMDSAGGPVALLGDNDL